MTLDEKLAEKLIHYDGAYLRLGEDVATICRDHYEDAESSNLDKAWHEVNALKEAAHTRDDRIYCEAIDAALAVIERLGGMDPLQRNLDPRTPEFGVAP